MKKLLLFPTLLAVLFFSSCKKDGKLSDDQTTASQNDLLKNVNPESLKMKPGDILFKASDAELKAKETAFRNEFKNEKSSFTARPSRCGSMLKASSAVMSIQLYSGSFCDNTAQVLVTYRWHMVEWGAEGIFSFNIDCGGTNHSPLSVSQGTPYYDCDPTLSDCFTERTFTVTVVLSQSEYSFWGYTTNTITRVGDNVDCTPASISNATSLVNPTTYYTDNPARIFIFPTGSGSIYVATQCTAILCYPPYTICPDAGTFRYRLVGSGTWISVNLFVAPFGNITGLAAGNYEYECVLIYSGVNTLPATGTFTI